jgi:hypothetical protein
MFLKISTPILTYVYLCKLCISQYYSLYDRYKDIIVWSIPDTVDDITEIPKDPVVRTFVFSLLLLLLLLFYILLYTIAVV